jgi:hypothetical protein
MTALNLVSILLCAQLTHAAGNIAIRVESSPDPTGSNPASTLYRAVIENGTASRLELKAVQMPGGYVGSGTFYPCLLQEWDPRARRWRLASRTAIQDFGRPTVRTVIIAAGDQTEVCREMLPPVGNRVAGGKAGACMRFVVRRSWDEGAERWTSTPFVAGKPTDPRAAPCAK